jgi:hypothetical protein
MNTHVPGVSSRRSACDRCRGQKLRCVRESPNQQSCDRCIRADAACLTSPVFHMRSYVTTSGDHGEQKQERVRKRLKSREHSPQSQERPSGDEAQLPWKKDAIVAVERINPPAVYAEGMSSNVFGTYLSPSTILGPPGDCSTVNTGDEVDWNIETSILNELMLSDGINKPNDLFGSTGTSSGYSISQVRPAVQDFASQLGSSTNSIPSSFSIPCLPDIDHHNKNHLSAIDSESDSSTNLVKEHAISNDTTYTKNLMQRLSKTNLHIVTLLVDIGKGSSAAGIGNIVSPIDNSVSAKSKLDQILDSTRELLEILTQLAASSPRDSVDDCSPTSSSKSDVPGSSYCRQPSGLSAQENAFSSSPTDSLEPSTSISVSHTGLHTSTKPDPALLLLILTTYISLSQLYTLLFSHVHSFLTELAESSNPYLCPLPGLIFCSFPLRM